jgi:RsiW-degrading membrane proteinase PrsW (M82 family)
MSDLEVATVEGTYVFSEGDVVTIGRRDDNTVILADPTVSRQHASIHFESGAWVLEDLSGGRTFHAGQPIARLEVTQTPETINLASPTGPWISASSGRIERTAGTAVASALSTDDTAGVPVVGATSAFTAGQSVGSAPAPSQWAPSRPVPPHGLPPGGAFPPAGQVPRPPAAPRGSLNSEQIKRALHILFPYRSWIENAGWRSRTRLIFLVYAMLPVVFLVAFLNTTNFQTLGWVYAIYTAPVWLTAFWFLIKPEDTPRTLAITGAAVTVIVLLVMAGPLQWWYRTVPDPQAHPGNWFGWLLAPGIAEEATKDGAVLITVLVAARFFKAQLGNQLGVRSCMFLGTVAGLAFGAREAALYQDKDFTAFGLTTGPHALVQYVLEFSLRIFTDGLQHAEWAGIACFFIGLGLNYTRRRVPLILFGYGFGAIIHATNDWSTGESSWLWIALQVLWAVLFLGYTLFAPSIEAQVKETSLFRGDSILAEQFGGDGPGGPLGPGPTGAAPPAPGTTGFGG